MAIQYLGTLISGLASDTKPTLTAGEKGTIFCETDTNKLFQWDTDSWNAMTSESLATTLSVAAGGTGTTAFTANGVLIGNATNAVATVDLSAKGAILIGDGSGNPQALSLGTDAYVLTADSTTATGTKWAEASGGGSIKITAGENLTAGKPVVVNSSGNAVHVATGGFLQHSTVESDGTGGSVNISYDPEFDKVLVFWRHPGSMYRYGMVKAGDVNATTGEITWGTECVFSDNSDGSNDIVTCHIPTASKHFVGYRSIGDSNNFNALTISVDSSSNITMYNANNGNTDTDNFNTGEAAVKTIDNGFFGNIDYDLNTHRAIDVSYSSGGTDYDQVFILHCDQTNGTTSNNYGRLCYSLVQINSDNTLTAKQSGSIIEFDAVQNADCVWDPDTERIIIGYNIWNYLYPRYHILYRNAWNEFTRAGPNTGHANAENRVINSGTIHYYPKYIRMLYDPDQDKVIMTWKVTNETLDQYFVAGTVSSAATSGMTVSWGTIWRLPAYVKNDGSSQAWSGPNHSPLVYDTARNRIILSGDYRTGKFEFYDISLSGTTFTLENAWDTESDAPEFPAVGEDEEVQAGLQQAVYDPDSGFVLTHIGTSGTASGTERHKVIVTDATAFGTIVNSDAYIGVNTAAVNSGAEATITVSGGLNENVTGLTPGALYYLSGGGELSTTATTGAKVGVAIAANKLLVGVTTKP